MAKIKFGMFMTDARGKVGGQVFSKNRSGAYVRTKSTPVNAQTSRQTFIRQLLGSISIAWSLLTANARLGFNNAVSNWSTTDIFGDSRNPSGKTLFTKLNLNLVNSGQAQVTNVPDKVDVPPLGDIEVQGDVTASSLEIVGGVVSAGSVILVMATAPQNAGVSYFKGKFRQIGFYPSASIATLDMWTDYANKFGAPAAGDNIAFEIKRVMPNGQAGLPYVVKATIVA